MTKDSEGPAAATAEKSRQPTSKLYGEAIASWVKSGFPFQLAVEKRLCQLSQRSIFPIAREVPWGNAAGTFGFVDLIADSNSAIFCCIECKRTDSSPLTFLRPQGEDPMQWSPFLFTNEGQDRAQYTVQPIDRLAHTEAAEFALFKNDSNLFEDTAAQVIAAAEAVADARAFRFEGRRSYFLPVFVTNVPIVICEFNPDEIDLEEAKLDGARTTSKQVPFLRFQKSFAPVERAHENARWVEKLVRNRQRRGFESRVAVSWLDRCLWVVTASQLDEFAQFVLDLGFALPDRP